MKVKKYQAYRISQVILHLGRNLKVQRSERNQMILRRLGIIKFRDEANGFLTRWRCMPLKKIKTSQMDFGVKNLQVQLQVRNDQY